MHLSLSVIARGMILIIMTGLVACQGTTPVKRSTVSKPIVQNKNVSVQITQREIPVVRSKDGIQDLKWTITQVKSKRALFFSDTPSIRLNSAHTRVMGHTGCNPIFGDYTIDVASRKISFLVNAGHLPCHAALAQEADLMEVLSRVESFELQAPKIQFLDKTRQVLITAEQR